MRKAAILTVTVLLFGCGASAAEFRGISSHSTCSSIVSSEQRMGAKLLGKRQETGASGPVQVQELAGEIAGVAVHIDVACEGEKLSMVVYSADVTSDAAASDAFDRLRSSVATQRETAQDQDGSHGRRVAFGCEPSESSVSLVEDLVSRGAKTPGAALLVVPRPGAC